MTLEDSDGDGPSEKSKKSDEKDMETGDSFKLDPQRMTGSKRDHSSQDMDNFEPDELLGISVEMKSQKDGRSSHGSETEIKSHHKNILPEGKNDRQLVKK